jgi:K+-transporting ATPase A subunit
LKPSKRIKTLAAFLIIAALTVKNASAAEMADTMRSDGKIWVVITVLSIILIGLFIYLFTIDRKISSVEKQIQDKKQ